MCSCRDYLLAPLEDLGESKRRFDFAVLNGRGLSSWIGYLLNLSSDRQSTSSGKIRKELSLSLTTVLSDRKHIIQIRKRLHHDDEDAAVVHIGIIVRTSW
jgi:hypothetical protein